MDPLYVAGTGHHVPETRVTNAELCRLVDTTEEWIVSRTGIEERRRAPEGVDTSDLGALATAAALDRTGWSSHALELLVCATSTPDRLIPATASLVCKKLGVDPVAFDVNAACSGFVYGLATATALARAHGWRRVALCTAEKYTRVTDYTDRATCVFFGDGAATLLIQPERPALGLEIVDLVMENVNEGADYVTTPVGGCFRQDGRRVKEYALRSFERSARQLLGRSGLAPSDLRAFVGHQANLRVLETVAEAVGVRPDQHWTNVARCGNQGAAGVATALCSELEARVDGGGEGALVHGDLILATVFGSGFTSGSALFRWIDER